MRGAAAGPPWRGYVGAWVAGCERWLPASMRLPAAQQRRRPVVWRRGWAGLGWGIRSRAAALHHPSRIPHPTCHAQLHDFLQHWRGGLHLPGRGAGPARGPHPRAGVRRWAGQPAVRWAPLGVHGASALLWPPVSLAQYLCIAALPSLTAHPPTPAPLFPAPSCCGSIW